MGSDRRVCCEGVRSVWRWWLCERHAVVEEGAGVAELGGMVLEGAAGVAVAAGGGASGGWSAGGVWGGGCGRVVAELGAAEGDEVESAVAERDALEGGEEVGDGVVAGADGAKAAGSMPCSPVEALCLPVGVGTAAGGSRPPEGCYGGDDGTTDGCGGGFGDDECLLATGGCRWWCWEVGCGAHGTLWCASSRWSDVGDAGVGQRESWGDGGSVDVVLVVVGGVGDDGRGGGGG